MTKAELTEKIIDAMIDPWNDDPNDYLYYRPIDINEATDLLDQLRDDEDKMDLEPEEKLPSEVTPELVMNAYNCLIRARKYEARTNRLAKYITVNEMVCEYANYYYPCHDDGIDIIPVDHIAFCDRFPFSTNNTENPDHVDVLRIGLNSAKTFNPNHEFCWFDKDKEVLHSTDRPFHDGTLNAEAFARFALEDKDTLDYFINYIMMDDEIKEVFGCTKEKLLKEVN